jgi:hypothetical protein
MTPTLHTILIYEVTVISHAIVPMGKLFKEVAEETNEHFRLYRQYFLRKYSREYCNNDVLKKFC